MRVNVVSFTNYKMNVDIYSKSDMDFFSYLLLNIIVKKHEHILLDDIRVDMDIPDKIAYLYVPYMLWLMLATALMFDILLHN